jgi:hypothetical protein
MESKGGKRGLRQENSLKFLPEAGDWPASFLWARALELRIYRDCAREVRQPWSTRRWPGPEGPMIVVQHFSAGFAFFLGRASRTGRSMAFRLSNRVKTNRQFTTVQRFFRPWRDGLCSATFPNTQVLGYFHWVPPGLVFSGPKKPFSPGCSFQFWRFCRSFPVENPGICVDNEFRLNDYQFEVARSSARTED